jgi:hypothetical protein
MAESSIVPFFENRTLVFLVPAVQLSFGLSDPSVAKSRPKFRCSDNVSTSTHGPDLGSSQSRKNFLNRCGDQRRIARHVLNIAMPEIRLDRTRVVTIVGELIAAGMAEHVGMCLDAQIGRNGCPLNHAGESGRR